MQDSIPGDPVSRILRAYRRRHGRPPRVVAFAPGRVEILGNHTDYNEGFALSAALELGVACAVGPGDTPGESSLCAADFGRSLPFPTAAPRPDADTPWANYGKGIVRFLPSGRVPDFHAVFGGNLPPGAGLASSGALGVSLALALARWAECLLSRLELARLVQRAETRFAGLRCGLLDPVSSLFGRKGEALLTDFRTLEVRTAPLPGDAALLLCPTGAAHRLAESEYNERRARCEEAVRVLAGSSGRPVAALRDVRPEDLAAAPLDPTTLRRARHVVGETRRALQGLEALERADAVALGRRMTESHESSRREFENSSPRQDQAVRRALALDGVLGARLTGGGFGGCALALVRRSRLEAVRREWAGALAADWGGAPRILPCTPSEGARLVIEPGGPGGGFAGSGGGGGGQAS